MKNFALIGAAGYVAPRHMKAIKETQNNLVAALDISDSVGIIDSYFPNAHFFTEFERFDRYISKLRYQENIPLDYVSICSPNYLHDAHIRFALRNNAHAICEKPLVLNPWNVEALQKAEEEFGKKIYTILQLRLHPAIIALQQRVSNQKDSEKYKVNLNYITSRGNWYHHSWKGNIEKSGGLATNIGIHFFDMLLWVFGKVENFSVEKKTQNSIKGTLELEKANIEWFLSINAKDLPKNIQAKQQTTFRSLQINDEEIDFTSGFEDLHTQSYKAILTNNGFGLQEALPSIQLVHEIRKK